MTRFEIEGLGLDLEGARMHLELASRYLREAEECLEKGDSVQACEKLYKVAEECVKAMSIALKLEEAEEAKRKGKWNLKLLDLAAKKLAEKINERIYDDWDHAYFLHVEGFHEARLSLEQVKARIKYVKELFEIAKNILQQGT